MERYEKLKTDLTEFFKKYDKMTDVKKQKDYIDLYTDYLISVRGEVTYDQIMKFLLKELLDSKMLWKEVKGVVREIEDELNFKG
jgi:hypothetical protein